MPEHAVERLLARIAGGADDRCVGTARIVCEMSHNMQTRNAQPVVLEDGTVFPGRSVGAPGIAAGELCFTTAIRGLRGGGDRPELRRAGALLRLPARRQLRRRPRADRVRPRPGRGDRHAHRASRSGPPGSATRASSRSTTSTRARSSAGSATRASSAAPSARRRIAELHARALAEPPIDGRPLDRHVGDDRAVHRRRRPARRAARPRQQALDRAPARGDGPRGRGRPGRLGRRRDARAEPGARCSSATGPATRACCTARSTPSATCSAACRSTASASATSSSASRSATGRSSCRSATAARTTPSATRAPAACSSPSRTTASRSAPTRA